MQMNFLLWIFQNSNAESKIYKNFEIIVRLKFVFAQRSKVSDRVSERKLKGVGPKLWKLRSYKAHFEIFTAKRWIKTLPKI